MSVAGLTLDRGVITVIAGVCYAATRNWLSGIELTDGTAWMDCEPWVRSSYISGVNFVVDRHCQGIPTTPKDLHKEWSKYRKANGWRYGAQKSVKEKTDPLLLPWEKLNPRERLRDKLFLNIVNTFLKDDGE